MTKILPTQIFESLRTCPDSSPAERCAARTATCASYRAGPCPRRRRGASASSVAAVTAAEIRRASSGEAVSDWPILLSLIHFGTGLKDLATVLFQLAPQLSCVPVCSPCCRWRMLSRVSAEAGATACDFMMPSVRRSRACACAAARTVQASSAWRPLQAVGEHAMMQYLGPHKRESGRA